MAKGDRYPAGYYPNAFQTAIESEGSGSSGRVDTEITPSEDSSAPMRKCISLNSDKHSAFSVPTQLLSLSNMAQSEKMDLIHRLRKELEEVRLLRRRVKLHMTDGFAMSSSSDVISCRNVQSEMRIGSQRKSSVFATGQGKKLNPSINKTRGGSKGSSGKFETAQQPPTSSTSTSTLMKQCETLLKRLMSHQYGWIFSTPVDVVKLNIPDYFTIIKHPMDLGTIKTKISSGAYQNPLEFAADLRLTFNNAMTYNPPGNDVHIMADTLSKYFEVRWKTIEKKLPATDPQLLPEKVGPQREMEGAKPTPPSKRRKVFAIHNEARPEPVKHIMKNEERQKIAADLESVLGELPIHIIDFLREHSSSGRESGEDEIEIDIDDLTDDTLVTLRKLLDDYFQEKQRNQEKAEPCEIELLNESGLSNSSTQPCKGNDQTDEVVDIGVNEHPVSGYTPTEVEKDTEPQSSKCLGSSSSSEFGTGLDQREETSQQRPSSVDIDCHQDGDGTTSDQEVSPEKRYRAALLKNRFADIILKAREKTLAQGNKGDPERIRKEKEALEMQRKKEKARLQAEAKAAEEARKQAEEETAAEAKRKRELEREAARQELLKMEKTVEINENSQFLEDLEMLRSGASEHLHGSVDEGSLDHPQDGLDGFNFGGGNPLEKLGLYMKQDDDGDEDGDLPSIPDPVNDVEEGEID